MTLRTMDVESVSTSPGGGGESARWLGTRTGSAVLIQNLENR